MCFNWKVLAGLGAVGVGLYVVRPDLVVSALPLLLLAACPLSMLFMGKAMSGHQAQPAAAATPEPAVGESREQQLARLRVELQSLSEQQSALARQIEAIEPAAPPSREAVEEAERVVRAAESRR